MDEARRPINDESVEQRLTMIPESCKWINNRFLVYRSSVSAQLAFASAGPLGPENVTFSLRSQDNLGQACLYNPFSTFLQSLYIHAVLESHIHVFLIK